MRIIKPAAVLTMLLTAFSCSRIFAPDGYETDKNWQVAETAHFFFYYRTGSFAEQHLDSIIAIEESAYEHIMKTLELNYSGAISVYIYNSPQDAGWEKTGGRAYPRTETVEAVYSPTSKSIGVKGAACHEITHVMTWNALGEPGTQFFSEGIAVAMDGEWRSSADTIVSVHQWTKKFLLEGTLPALNELIGNWNGVPGSISYPVSGSFVRFLLEEYGAEKLKQLFYRATPDNFNDEFQRIYHASLPSVEQRWQEYCQCED
ncbi:peptidase MA family metallohydrolase [Calditrichota bacterium LG25]